MITPSNFNVFRDSLRETSEHMRLALNDNLPEMNLDEIDSGDESDVGIEVVPLDFRTAMMSDQTQSIIIQAKPLNFETIKEEETKLMRHDDLGLNENFRPFKETDQDVIMIDPDLKADQIFQGIDLPCVKEPRINNSLKAPVRSQKQAAPLVSQKHYDEDGAPQTHDLINAQNQLSILVK